MHASAAVLLLITLTEAIAITIENEPKIINRSVSQYPGGGGTTVTPPPPSLEKKFEDYQLLKGT